MLVLERGSTIGGCRDSAREVTGLPHLKQRLSAGLGRCPWHWGSLVSAWDRGW